MTERTFASIDEDIQLTEQLYVARSDLWFDCTTP